MTTRTLTIQVDQTGSAKAGFGGLISEADKADKAFDKLKGTSGGLSSGLSDLADSFGLPLSPAAAATAGVAALGTAIAFSVGEARAGRAEQAQLAAVLTSTGHAAGVSQVELNKHAEALENITNVDAGATNSAQALLLTFTKIGREVFPEATKTVLDMSTALGQDLKSSSIQLGKALNDPIAGITALSRVGVSFTDSQKEMIKSLVESGDIIGAQRVILKELNTEFGGSAEAARVADGGFIALGNSALGLADAFGNLFMSANEGTGAIEGLVGVVQGMTESVNLAAGAWQEGLIPGFLHLIDSTNPVIAGLEKLGIDIIPNFTAASDEAAAAVEGQATAHSTASAAAAEQESAIQTLSTTQIEAMTSLGQLEEQYNEKKQGLLDNRLKAESDAAKTTAENQRNLNEELNALNLEHGKLTAEQLEAKKQKILANYQEENTEIQTKLMERQQAIDDQLAQEQQRYEEKAQELKLVMAAQALEQSGQLEELTGIAGITAEQYVQAVKYGAIEANREVETAMGQIVRNFEGHQRSQDSIAKTNAESIKRVLGESATGSANSWKQATNSIVSDFERQAAAAYRAAQAGGGSTNYSSTRRNTDWGPGFAQGGTFVVPPGYENDSFPVWVESGEHVTVIPRDQAGRMPKFASGTGSGFVPLSERVRGYGMSGGKVRRATDSDYVSLAQFEASEFGKGNYWSKPGGGRFSKMTDRQKLDAMKARLGKSGGSASSTASSSASEVVPAIASSPARGSSLGGGGMVFNIAIQYNPTVSTADQYELVRAIKPAIEEVLRLNNIQVTG